MMSFLPRGLLGRSAERTPDGLVAPDLVPGPGRLVLAAVCLEPVLEDVTAVAEPGSLVAVVSDQPSARSMLLSIAAGMIVPDSGRVSLDRQDLAEHSADSVRRTLVLAHGTADRSDLEHTRALVVLVDEPAVTVDAALHAMRGRHTILVATHRPELVGAADSIWLLESGRIVESGPPLLLLGNGSRTEQVLRRARSA
jgi:ABC-type multidrug transport system fused ATPase/permease subunit